MQKIAIGVLSRRPAMAGAANKDNIQFEIACLRGKKVAVSQATPLSTGGIRPTPTGSAPAGATSTGAAAIVGTRMNGGFAYSVMALAVLFF